MITILIDFFDKDTEKHILEFVMDFPDEMVFSAAKGEELEEARAEGKQIDYINCRPFDVTEDMKNYAVLQRPELREMFDKYLYEFIGRHGLGPEYF